MKGLVRAFWTLFRYNKEQEVQCPRAHFLTTKEARTQATNILQLSMGFRTWGVLGMRLSHRSLKQTDSMLVFVSVRVRLLTNLLPFFIIRFSVSRCL